MCIRILNLEVLSDLLLMLGSFSGQTASPLITEGNNWCMLTTVLDPDNHCAFHFQYLMNCMRYSMLCCQIGFVLDDFAQL